MRLGRREHVWMAAIGAMALAQFWGAGETPVQLAYIGPGAGFAFLGSFLTLIAGFFVSAAALLTWPVRMLYRLVKRRGGLMQAKARKVIFLGLDGFDPVLAEQFLKDGKLPNLQRLQQAGGYARLRTTFPPLSPVAWSSFATGVSPARHAMFDFLNRNLKSYLPELSSAAVRPPGRVLKLGKYRIPLGAPVVELKRKSKAFWHLLGEHFIPCTVLRVPITFPPENFQGQMLSAMCTPDLLGTQGTFSFFTTQMVEGEMESGNRYPLMREGAGWKGTIEGPANGLVEGGGPLQIPFRIEPEKKGGWRLVIGRKRHALVENEYTPWIRLEFRAGLGTVSGISRFLFKQGMLDAERETVAIRRAWPSGALYRGPYLEAAPDLIVGYGDGYRASWDAAVGKVSGRIMTDNTKAWSGDHCIDPHLVPGVLYCNRAFAAADPGIEDMAASALDLFGVPRPAWMEGRSIFAAQAGEKASREEAA